LRPSWSPCCVDRRVGEIDAGLGTSRMVVVLAALQASWQKPTEPHCYSVRRLKAVRVLAARPTGPSAPPTALTRHASARRTSCQRRNGDDRGDTRSWRRAASSGRCRGSGRPGGNARGPAVSPAVVIGQTIIVGVCWGMPSALNTPMFVCSAGVVIRGGSRPSSHSGRRIVCRCLAKKGRGSAETQPARPGDRPGRCGVP
jgi:hypothetical protein